MKKTLSLTCMLCACLFLSAQTDSLFNGKTVRFQGQIGINATSFLKQFLVFNSLAIPQTSPFDVNGKFLVGLKYSPSLLIGPRIGFGYTDTHSFQDNEQQTNERSSDDKSRAVRIGLELQHIISKRWIVYYGIDYINTTASTSTISTFTSSNGFPPVATITRTEIVSNNKTTGGGPILGVQFNLNRWVCLGTETSFYYTQSTAGSKTTSSNPNNTSPEIFANARSTSIMLPFFINCNIVF